MHNVGIIGCGGMGGHHARTLSRMENCDVVAVCDIVPEKAEKLGAEVDAKAVIDYHDLLDDVDAVWVCTEPFNRLNVVPDCAAAGKHVFSEKPVALDLETADAIIESVERAGVTFMVDYVLRFTNPYRAVHDVFASGELGDLVNVWTRRYMPCDMRGKWYGEQEKSGGAALDFGSHDFDMLLWFGGAPKTVFGRCETIRDGLHADEHAQGMIVFADGGMGSSDISWWGRAGVSTFGVTGTKGACVLDGSGEVRKHIDGEEETVLDVNAAVDIDPEGNLGKDSGGTAASASKAGTVQEHFFECVETGATPLVSHREAREVLRTVLAIVESSRTGKSVDL